MKISNIIAFLGAGKMAGAIAGGLIRNGMVPEQLRACDISPSASATFAARTGVQVETDAVTTLSDASIIILAVKPQNIRDVLHGMHPHLQDKLLISIAAGVTLATLTELSGHAKIVRVMPNTPALIGNGISAYSCAPQVNANEKQLVEAIFSAVGMVAEVAEKQMDAITGLSGSGPAYVFDFIQGLADGGVYSGLPRDLALRFAAQTVAGAANLLLAGDEHPAVLKDQVTSPAGTTSRGLFALESNGFKGIVAKAVIAAADRSHELSNM